MYRHGDILLERVGDCPTGRYCNRRMVLAQGELTGHAHAINAPGRLTGNRLLLPVGGTVTHEEHGPIVLEPGEYAIRHQREYTPIKRWVRVRD